MFGMMENGQQTPPQRGKASPDLGGKKNMGPLSCPVPPPPPPHCYFLFSESERGGGWKDWSQSQEITCCSNEIQQMLNIFI